MKIVVIMCINTFQKKTSYQVNELNKHGYIFHVLTYDQFGDSIDNLMPVNKLYILKENLFLRFFQVLYYLFRSIKKNISHVEYYPSNGGFNIVALLLLRLFRKKIIIFERGDFRERCTFSIMGKFFYDISFRLSKRVLCTEFLLESEIQEMAKIGGRNVAYIHNSVNIPDRYNELYNTRDIDFLWVNRLIRHRKSSWFCDVLQENNFINTNNFILGFLKNQNAEIDQAQKYILNNKPLNLTIINFEKPMPYYNRARFFVYPCDHVMANFALLEAMSYGVIPIVSDVSGAELLVKNNSNGLIFHHSKKGLRDILVYALSLTQNECENMSARARMTINNNFSTNTLVARHIIYYESL